MLIVDDIVLFPVKSILWIFREIYNATQQELAGQAETITAELSELYMMLDTGRISEAEFEAREKELLDKLEEIEEREYFGDKGQADEDEEEFDEDEEE